MQPILEAALEYARLGYRVIPLKPGTKTPDLRRWPEEASNNPAQVRLHFNESARRNRQLDSDDIEPDYPNVGIVTGNGLAVVDVDRQHDGDERALPVDLQAVLNRTLAAKTASGGRHYYLAVDKPVPNSVGRLAPGIDVRGERGQVAAPPSVVRSNTYRLAADPDGGARANGGLYRIWDTREYAWLNDQPIQSVPAEWLTPVDLQQDYEGRRRRFEFRDFVPVGERNNYLTSMAGYLFANGDAAEDVEFQLNLESRRLEFSPREDEIHKIVQSVGRYHREA